MRTLQIETAAVNGIPLRVARQGTGPLVLLRHGFPELWCSWLQQRTALADAGSDAMTTIKAGYPSVTDLAVANGKVPDLENDLSHTKEKDGLALS